MQAIYFGIPAFFLNALMLPMIFVVILFDIILHGILWEERGEDPKDFLKYVISSPFILIIATVFVLFDCVALSIIKNDTVFWWHSIYYEDRNRK